MSLLAQVTGASTPPPGEEIRILRPDTLNTFTSLSSLIGNAVIIVFIAASFIIFVMIVWGAIEWILSAGDKDKVANARKRITAAIIGFVLLVLSYLIIGVIGNIIGFNPLQPFNLPTPS